MKHATTNVLKQKPARSPIILLKEKGARISPSTLGGHLRFQSLAKLDLFTEGWQESYVVPYIQPSHPILKVHICKTRTLASSNSELVCFMLFV